MICKSFVSNYTKMGHFQPLGVVGRSSETQLQVDENLKYFILQDKY